MSHTDKPKQIHTLIARERKLKGNNRGIFFTLPLRVATLLNIERGDLIEIEIRRITKNPGPEQQAMEVTV